MFIGSSTNPRLHLLSHGLGHTLAIDAGNGWASSIILRASASRPAFIKEIYSWQLVSAGQASWQGALQSPVWAENCNSSKVARALVTRFEAVDTTIPCAAIVAQARSNRFIPSISTTHSPHDPWGGKRASLHMLGIKISASSAAFRIVVPLHTWMGLLSIVRLIKT